MSSDQSQTTLPRVLAGGNYDRRCGVCKWSRLQNEAVGDCALYNADVLHHLVRDCPNFSAKENQHVA